ILSLKDKPKRSNGELVLFIETGDLKEKIKELDELKKIMEEHYDLIRNYDKAIVKLKSNVDIIPWEYDKYRLASEVDNINSSIYATHKPSGIDIDAMWGKFKAQRDSAIKLYDEVFASQETYVKSTKKY